MPITGVYFIPSNPNASTALASVMERIRASFPDEDLVPVSRWALEQKLMRDTPGLLPASANPQKPAKPRYMQLLSLTHYPNHGFIYTSEPAETLAHAPASAPGAGASAGAGAGTVQNTAPAQTPGATQPVSVAPDTAQMVMTTVPPTAFGTLFQHFTYACQPSWCHRLTVGVPNGVVYDIGDFRVRLGDVRQTYPTARARGTLVEIEWRGPSILDALFSAVVPTADGTSNGVTEHDGDSGIDVSLVAIEEADVDAEYAATAVLIREFWARVGVEGAREAIVVPGIGKEVKERVQRERGQAGKTRGYEEAFTACIGGVSVDEDPDPQAGVDLARQYMEVLRFNR
ncbi:Mediator complex subunit Med20 [Penicillium capsulatum]|uniref:Mediator of RNA polymerase II transcription subunit 20 n=1 Tax=Penicillium capsulatum TaxID=69766 RepID=A0A9W9LFL0_9EURO|nr:Mediator complex subunit Med20 [Penicillium capsulatum]KAJ6105442.1 Mediator complex subunit Med20 [Penicillium capsulatum]